MNIIKPSLYPPCSLLLMPELRCHECSRFVHSGKANYFKIPFLFALVFLDQFSHKILTGDAFYVYRCPSCSSNGVELFERLPISWYQIIS